MYLVVYKKTILGICYNTIKCRLHPVVFYAVSQNAHKNQVYGSTANKSDEVSYLFEVDVIQIVECVDGLNHPALGSVQIESKQRRLRHIQELRHRTRSKAASCQE